eukprot:PLAT6527.1.p1 GENE.PLAT6527.1~~PLAT6527.1.p1  ORF type:complete len:259 (-),score=115.43 PLAT6527.1:205-981(-)
MQVNVGGIVFEVDDAVLSGARARGCKLVSGAADGDIGGIPFFDCDPRAFQDVLAYLRGEQLGSERATDMLLSCATYFNLAALVTTVRAALKRSERLAATVSSAVEAIAGRLSSSGDVAFHLQFAPAACGVCGRALAAEESKTAADEGRAEWLSLPPPASVHELLIESGLVPAEAARTGVAVAGLPLADDAAEAAADDSAEACDARLVELTVAALNARGYDAKMNAGEDDTLRCSAGAAEGCAARTRCFCVALSFASVE